MTCPGLQVIPLLSFYFYLTTQRKATENDSAHDEKKCAHNEKAQKKDVKSEKKRAYHENARQNETTNAILNYQGKPGSRQRPK